MKIKWLAGPMEVLGAGLMDTGNEYEVSDKIGSDLIAEAKAEAVGASTRTRKPFKVDPDQAPEPETKDGDEGDG